MDLRETIERILRELSKDLHQIHKSDMPEMNKGLECFAAINASNTRILTAIDAYVESVGVENKFKYEHLPFGKRRLHMVDLSKCFRQGIEATKSAIRGGLK